MGKILYLHKYSVVIIRNVKFGTGSITVLLKLIILYNICVVHFILRCTLSYYVRGRAETAVCLESIVKGPGLVTNILFR